MKIQKFKGFTLIEFMIVIAIIGILVAISIPLYNDFIAKSTVTSALAEIAPAKSKYEEEVNSYGVVGTFTISSLGLEASNSGSRCTNVAINNPIADGSATPAISCTVGGAQSVSGAIIELNRTAAGSWTCTIDSSSAGAWNTRFIPNGCT